MYLHLPPPCQHSFTPSCRQFLTIFWPLPILNCQHLLWTTHLVKDFVENKSVTKSRVHLYKVKLRLSEKATKIWYKNYDGNKVLKRLVLPAILGKCRACQKFKIYTVSRGPLYALACSPGSWDWPTWLNKPWMEITYVNFFGLLRIHELYIMYLSFVYFLDLCIHNLYKNVVLILHNNVRCCIDIVDCSIHLCKHLSLKLLYHSSFLFLWSLKVYFGRLYAGVMESSLMLGSY